MCLILEYVWFIHLFSRLKDEKHIHNPAYEETHQFSNSVSKASSSKGDEYSEISENNVSLRKLHQDSKML